MNNTILHFNKTNRYKTEPPCYKCKLRKAGCHPNCSLYKDYIVIHEIEKKEVKEIKARQSDSLYRLKQTKNTVNDKLSRNGRKDKS